MEYDTLKCNINRLMASTQMDLAHCHDVYRLETVISKHIDKMTDLLTEAQIVVHELENGELS